MNLRKATPPNDNDDSVPNVCIQFMSMTLAIRDGFNLSSCELSLALV